LVWHHTGYALQLWSYTRTHARTQCLQCFDAVGWAAGRASAPVKNEWWGAGVVVCLEQGADLHVAQLMPLPLTHCLLLQLNPDWFYLSGTGSPR